MPTTTFDHCILGAGIAGLAMATKLLQHSQSVVLIDPNGIASGASGTPLGLVNPATGRYGTKTWNAELCLEAITEDLKLTQSASQHSFFKNTGILRPAQDEKMAQRMEENARDPQWPEGWCTWLDKKELHSINSGLHCVKGGMWLPKGLTVNVEEYLRAKSKILQKQGLTLITGENYELSVNKSSETSTFSFDSHDSISARTVIFTSGIYTKEFEEWTDLPLIPVKGQIAAFETSKAGDFDYSISALGYIASVSKNRFVAGSTYEHNFDHEEPDQQGLEYLINRLSKVYPELFEDAKLIEQWAGVRASTPNRKPIMGRHPRHAHHIIFAGLGSKGLIYSQFLAEKLTNYLLLDEALPEEVSIHRIAH